MEKDKIITFRVPVELAEKMKATSETLNISMAEFIKNRIDYFYNPPPTPPREIQEVPVEVEKIVYVTSDGEVRGERTIDLDDQVYAELVKTKLQRMSLSDHVNGWIWQKIENSKKYYPQNSGNRERSSTNYVASSQNGDTSNPPPISSPDRITFPEYQQMKTECETMEDWKEVKKEILADPYLTEKQKNFLLNSK